MAEFVRFDDLVSKNNFQWENADEARSEGIEGLLSMMPCKYFRLSAAYTYTKAEENNEHGEWVNDNSKNLPENKINVTALFYLMDRLTANFGFLRMDEVESEYLTELHMWKTVRLSWIWPLPTRCLRTLISAYELKIFLTKITHIWLIPCQVAGFTEV